MSIPMDILTDQQMNKAEDALRQRRRHHPPRCARRQSPRHGPALSSPICSGEAAARFFSDRCPVIAETESTSLSAKSLTVHRWHPLRACAPARAVRRASNSPAKETNPGFRCSTVRVLTPKALQLRRKPSWRGVTKGHSQRIASLGDSMSGQHSVAWNRFRRRPSPLVCVTQF